MSVAPHIQRVIDERSELQDKIGNLEVFILTNAFFKTLPNEEQRDMRQQYDAMQLYSNILKSRLDRALGVDQEQ